MNLKSPAAHALPRAGCHRLRSTPLASWRQRIAHLVALAIGWILFAWAWRDVLAQSWDVRTVAWLIVGSLLLLPLATSAWILHNVGIHRRKGPRTGVRRADDSYAHDWNGRPVRADWRALARSRIVLIEVEGTHKVYRPGPHPPELAFALATDAHGTTAARASERVQ